MEVKNNIRKNYIKDGKISEENREK